MNNRFNNPPRDRSPPRYDRRPSANAYPSGGSSYRGGESFQPASDRDPPLGPKAQRPDSFAPRYPFSPAIRGRGGGPPFTSRPSNTWEPRDRILDRDTRPSQSYRSRDDDRPDWPRRERDLISNDRGGPAIRDARPYTSRDRSASPPRARRDSRESIPPLSSRPSDSSSYYGPSARGGLARGRGRGDWSDRGRGRNSFASDRGPDLFSNRSQSREEWRDRDYDRQRPTAPDGERSDRFDRRDHERPRELDSRREYDNWQRDQSPGRVSTGAPGGRGISPVTAERSTKMEFEMGRRSSAVLTPGSLGRDRRDHEQADYFGNRSDAPRRDGSLPSYQSQPAQTPAAGVGLDYGPPPSAPAPGAGASEKPAPGKSTAARSEATATTSLPFQPPSAPKADRAASSTLSQPPKPITQQEPQIRGDLTSRPPRAPVGLGLASTDHVTKAADSRVDLKPPMHHTPDKSMPANVPIGPRASLGSGFKARQLSSEPVAAATSSSKAVPSDHRNVPIPTGPRSDQPTWSTVGTSRNTWQSTEYRSKPSIMNPLGRDRPSFAPPAGPRSHSILPPHNEKPRIFPMHQSKGTPTSSSSPSFGQKPGLSPTQGHARPDVVSFTEDVDMSLPASSDEEDEFDEDDYAADEEKHLQERLMLEAKKPPPLFQDTSIRNLLIRIQFLNMIMHEVIPKSMAPVQTLEEKLKAPEPPSIGLPSPKELSEEHEGKPELKHPQPRGRPLSQPAINPIPTPPIEDLPFLSKQSPQRIAFDESDDEVEHEAITTLIRQEFEQAAFDWQDELQDMHTTYCQRFPMWKTELTMQDYKDRDVHPSPAPASPAPSVPPSVTPSMSHERTRGARNTTEADLQAAILMSQQSLKEEEERREREAASNSEPNYDTEAMVPPMMKPTEVEFKKFEDTNKLISIDLAIEVFAYVPPEDDFTPEEQLLFIREYCQQPKKWGKIAEYLPGRTYKDCITHYYLTKNETNYKAIWRNSQPKRKRGRAATKPRSTALMSELVYDNEGDGTVAVTDTGRPRRAAAPTFGDTPGEADAATSIPQSKRLAMGNGEPVAARPGRGRKAGGPAKPRRTKAQMQEAAMLHPPGAADGSPQKVAVASRGRDRTLLRAENGGMRADMTASPDMPRLVDIEVGQYALTDVDRMSFGISATANNQPTSYWSVPEQQKFPQLIAYYGRDFASIADFMKTKTVTMIKNHYNRQIQDGKSDLEEIARIAERRTATGQPMGNPPSPAAPTKRRYEATPSTASMPRPTHSQSDQAVPDTEQSVATIKSGYTDDFPANAVQRSTSGVDLIAKPRIGHDILRESQLAQQSKNEEAQRSSIFTQKPLNGPRPGFFKEESSSYGPPSHSLHNQSPHQHPVRASDPRAGGFTLGQSLLGQPREHLGSLHSAMQPPSSQPMTHDRFGAPTQQAQHVRSGSLGMIGHHPTLQETRDSSSFRRLESNPRQSPYLLGLSQPPSSLAQQSSIPSRTETSSTGPTPEPPRPAPAKRSNLMNLLNDDPPEPQPQKRSSLDSTKRSSVLSPQPIPVTSQSLSFEAARAQARPDELHGMHQNMRGSMVQTPVSRLSGISLRDSQPGFQGSQTDQGWMDRFDPRPQTGPTEQAMHSSPRVGGYSVVPPNTSSHQGGRMDTQRSAESGHPDHRRMLSQMNRQILNPSPPPQPHPSQSIYRSLSGSSQHGRFGSTGFSQSQSLSQPSPHMHSVQQPPGPPSHPTSAGSTPVSSLHHRGQPSIDYQPQRLTIQQHLAQQSQTQHPGPPVHLREREHEEALRRQREEMQGQQQQMRMPERDHDLLGRPRDMLSFGSRNHEPQSRPSTSHHHQSQHSSHNQHQHQQHQQIMAGVPGARHLGYGGHQQQPQQHEPVTRTYTPPAALFGGPGSSMLGHAHQHSHHQHHQQGPGPAQQHQHPGQGQHQGAPGPGHNQSSHFAHGHGHYRGMSQGEPREERR